MHSIVKIGKTVTSDINKIMIPVLRKVLPSLMAQDIVGVQPMQGPIGQTMSMNMKTDNGYILFKNYPVLIHNMLAVHTAIRPFMRKNQLEPNHHYRPWLEEHIGAQGVEWDWKIHSVNGNLLAIDFANQEMATLFELTWP